MAWLEYQREVVETILNSDGIVIAGSGLGLTPKVVSHMVNLYCHSSIHPPRPLIFILNASNQEKETLHGPIAISATSNSKERMAYYAKGGTYFVTSRILIVDLLNERLDPMDISGLLVLNAHAVTESSIEAFIIRIYRSVNRKGFLKGFSSHAARWVSGFSKVEATMKLMYIQQLWLYPRFHSTVAASLEAKPPDVIEIEQPLSTNMINIQNAIVVAMEACLAELKKIAKNLDASDLTVQNAMLKSTEISIRRQLDPMWHKLPLKTKQLVEDLSVLRQLLGHLTRYDAISFYTFLLTLKSVSAQQQFPSFWLFTEAADRIFAAAKSRLYTLHKSSKSPQLKLALEPNPKWEALTEVLEEVEQELDNPTANNSPPVLVLTKDERTSMQLRELLVMGSETMMQRRFVRYVGQRIVGKKGKLSIEQQLQLDAYHKLVESLKIQRSENSRVTTSNGDSKKRPLSSSSEVPEAAAAFGVSSAELEIISQQQYEDNSKKQAKTAKTNSGIDGIEFLSPMNVMVASYRNESESQTDLLDTLQPRVVILYDPDVTFIRKLEVYNAECCGNEQLRVYFLVYEDSAEQQAYLTEISKEKEAFEKLIHQKAHMLVPSNMYECFQKQDIGPAALSLDTRTSSNGSQKGSASTRIIVDVREFRSALPSMLHREGLDIRPVTLEVGDFILTPSICVERKSIPDLFGSFKSGRLYNQVEQMTRYYDMPVVLIEFTESKSFSLQDPSQIKEDISVNSACSKMVLLILQFPKMRLLWAKSPRETVKLFKALKRGKSEPDLETAASVGSGNSAGSDAAATAISSNVRPVEILMKLPGITQYNYRKVAKSVKTLAGLSRQSRKQLQDLMGEKPGTQLYNFMHKRYAAAA